MLITLLSCLLANQPSLLLLTSPGSTFLLSTLLYSPTPPLVPAPPPPSPRPCPLPLDIVLEVFLLTQLEGGERARELLRRHVNLLDHIFGMVAN